MCHECGIDPQGAGRVVGGTAMRHWSLPIVRLTEFSTSTGV